MFYLPEDLAKFPEVIFKYIKTQREGKTFIVTLNRPEKRNAFTPAMVDEIAFTLEYANSKQSIWCIVIEAEGPVFCAGMDLQVFQNPQLDERNASLPSPMKEINLGEAFKNIHKPSIAKIKGDVLAGGFLIIAGCTFVVSSLTANFCLPEVKRGLFPMQVMGALLQIIPKRKVLEMCILAKNYTAEEALNLGIVTHLADPEQVDATCKTLVEKILRNSPYAIQKGMEALQVIPSLQDNEQYSYLLDQLKLIKCSEDAKEGIEAFKEKRSPAWKNK